MFRLESLCILALGVVAGSAVTMATGRAILANLESALAALAF
jgi:hypothetical protein